MTDDLLTRPPGPDDVASMRWLHWWGPATFFGCGYQPHAAGLDIAVLGVPLSTGNGSREHDQHLAPRAIRDVSALMSGGRHPQLGIDPFSTCRIADVGDVLMREFMVCDRAIIDVERRAREIRSDGARLVGVGGDHSVTLPLLRAAAAAAGRPLALVHLDAHKDDYDQELATWYGVRYSAGHWASHAVREGLVDPGCSIQIGMRGLEWSDRNSESHLGYEIIDRDRFAELGLEGVVAATRDRVGDSPIYVSFDLDVLDPAAAPAASNFEPGEEGLSMREALRTIRGLRGLEILGADLVCYVPTKDAPNRITAHNSAAVLFEVLCLMAERVQAMSGN